MSWDNRAVGILVATVLAMINMGCNPDRSAEYEALQAQITQMQQQLIGAQIERAEWQAKHLEATQALTATRQELETLTSNAGTSLQQEATGISTTPFIAIHRELSQIKDEIAAVRQDHVMALPATRSMLRQEIASLSQGLSQVPTTPQTPGSEATSPNLDQLRQTAQAAMTERDALQVQLTQVQTELELAQAERDEARQTLGTADQAQLRQLQNTVQTLNAEREMLQAQLAARAPSAPSAVERQDTAALQAQLAQLRAELNTARQQLSAQQGRIWEKTGETRKMKEQSAQQLKESIQANIVTLQQDEDELQIRIGGRTLFNPGAITLRTQGRQTLNEIATVLRQYPDYRLQIEGHTDNDPVTNPDRKCWATNWELSALRAASAARYLETQNIAPERLAIIGRAYHQPLASNDTPRGKAQNRRIEIRVSPSPH